MIKVGIVGWRGMVGSVLLERMIEKKDLHNFRPIFFSTSQHGKKGPSVEMEIPKIRDAYDFKHLSSMRIIVSCQGSIYTKQVHRRLRDNGWKGYWLDVASELRMKKQSIIVLDPVNKKNINKALSAGVLDFIGGNCTVSLMLMALHGLIERGWVDWITSMTYQASSGAGANKIREMLFQMRGIGNKLGSLLDDPLVTILEIDHKLKQTMHDLSFLSNSIGGPVVANLVPWIDKAVGNGQTREEWKGFAEANKIMGYTENDLIPIDGQCVRVDTIRCHSQALTIKLKQNISLENIENVIKSSNKWVKVIENNEEATISKLNPSVVSGTLGVHIGRLRKLNVGRNCQYLSAFTVGDQLLWGAAEPIRRALNIVIEYIS